MPPQYPNTDKVTKPPSMPKHYVNLMDGLRKAERGETEPWYENIYAEGQRNVLIFLHITGIRASSGSGNRGNTYIERLADFTCHNCMADQSNVA